MKIRDSRNTYQRQDHFLVVTFWRNHETNQHVGSSVVFSRKLPQVILGSQRFGSVSGEMINETIEDLFCVLAACGVDAALRALATFQMSPLPLTYVVGFTAFEEPFDLSC